MQSFKMKRFMNQRITIFRRGGEPDKYGGFNQKLDKVAYYQPCRIYATRGTFRIQWEGKDINATHKLMCSSDVDLRRGDKVTDECDKRTFMVVNINKVHVDKQLHHIEATLSEIAQS